MDGPADRILLLNLDGPSHALRLSSVAGVADCNGVHRVPGAPAPVRGIVEWQGNVLIVLDLPYLLGIDTAGGPDCLIRLAAPLEHVALRVPARLQMTTMAPEQGGIRMIDPHHLLRDLTADDASRA